MKLFFRIAGVLLLLTGTIADFDLSDALDDDNPKATEPPAPPKTNDDFGLDLSDALGGDDPVPPKPPVVNKPSGGGSGGTIKDSDLFDIGGYEPEGGKYDGNGGGAGDSGYNSNSGGDQPVQEAGSGQIAGIVSAVGVALLGAASSYFAYQKKKLCFKIQGGQDPESGNRHVTQSEPQVMSNLIQS
ncbi:unnamed protein product [Knipowitschia caucasica]|uniref:CD99 antigen-like protein 2 n=1 Tax=Knipowitschia caucasica TaxID=637954 RepID=A0AAV2LC60_KNICA